jgi:hypothetical protein
MEDNKMAVYKSPFTSEITVNTKEEAVDAYIGFCGYCNKDGISQFHCSWADAKKCHEVMEQIIKDFSNKE